LRSYSLEGLSLNVKIVPYRKCWNFECWYNVM